MAVFTKFLLFLSVTFVSVVAEDTDLFLDDLFREISLALNAEASPFSGQMRQHYRPPNNPISLGVYEALRSIAKNDELECISRLLCEAAAGGKPGYSGKQLQFDTNSLTNLISYLRLDSSSSSPLLVFGRAALLGASNRGDPYSCIVNYPKCPKDQSRLLYYLNNHRGGFFQYFDKKYHKPGNYYYQNQYRPGYYYQKYQKRYKQNKIQFETSNALYEKYKQKAADDVYAKKYTYLKIKFPEESYNRKKKSMVFPDERSYPAGVDSRILTKLIKSPSPGKSFVFLSQGNRFPKEVNFFPEKDGDIKPVADFVSDRLPPSRLHLENIGAYNDNFPVRYSQNSFFPNN